MQCVIFLIQQDATFFKFSVNYARIMKVQSQIISISREPLNKVEVFKNLEIDKLENKDVSTNLNNKISKIVNLEKRKIDFSFFIQEQKISIDLIDESNQRISIKNENIPKELSNITNPQSFSVFVDSVYTKVSKLSDGEYKIYINVRGLGGVRGSQNDRVLRAQMIEAMVDEADKQGIEVVNNREAQSWISKTWNWVKKNSSKILSGLASIATIVASIFQSIQSCNIF